MYSKAFGSCKPGSGEDAGKVECVAEQSKYVTYIFSGKWAGAQDIIPPDDTLKAGRSAKSSGTPSRSSNMFNGRRFTAPAFSSHYPYFFALLQGNRPCLRYDSARL